MSATERRGGGSFRELRERHLPLFEGPWLPARSASNEESQPPPGETKRKPAWKRVGIAHFPDEEDA